MTFEKLFSFPVNCLMNNYQKMKINRYTKPTLIAFVFLSIFISNIQSQESYLYNIAVQQRFSSWGGCSSDPDYEYADIELLFSGSSTKQEIIYSDRLNDVVTFNHNFYNNRADKDLNYLEDINGNRINQFNIHTRASDIVNDKDIYYNFSISELAIGKVQESHEASDPCNNFISSNREGYTMTTIFYIDDPIFITETGDSRYILDYETLDLEISSFYRNGRAERPYLQVALDDGSNNWQPVEGVSLSPGSTLRLSYSQIAGLKEDPSSNYYNWMGRNLKFRAVKTLLGGDESTGNIVAGVVFYPEGLEYTVLQSRRTTCSNNVSIYVKLNNSADQGFFNLDPSLFFWRVSSGVDMYNCTMQPTDEPLEFQIITDQGGMPVDPFSEPNSIPIEWTLQLIDMNNPGSYACERNFTIPPKPDSITINKSLPLYNINGVDYDLPDTNNKYAILEINDPFDFAHLRRPYKVFDGTDTLATIQDIPDTYANMTQTQRDSIDAIFEAEYTQMLSKPNNAYESYFDVKLSEWMNDNPNGIELPIQDYSYPFVFSHDGSFFLYEHNNLIYKVTENTDGTFNVEQKTDVGTQGVDIGSISPDDNTLIYTLGSCCSGATLWQTPLNESGINNGTQISLPFNAKIGGMSSIVSENQVFINNYNIVITRPGWSGGNGIYKSVLATGALTTMFDDGSSVNDAQVLPSQNRILFRRTGYEWYRGTISAGTLTNITYLFTGSELLLSPDNSFAIYDRDGSTYRYYLTGAQAGTETEVASREIVEYARLTSEGICYYYHLGESPNFTTRGIYRTDLTGGIGARIINVKAFYFDIAPNNKYMVYNDYETGKSYKLYLGKKEAASDYYPNNGIASAWYDEYKAIYKEKWLNKRLGIKVPGVKVNVDQDLILYDKDGCDYPFTIHVKALINATFGITNIVEPSDACALDGRARILYLGGGSPPYVHANGTLRSFRNSINVGGLGYGDNPVTFYDANGNESETITITIGSSTQGITSTPVQNQTCASPDNGTITINVGSIAGTKEYKLTNENTFEEYVFNTTANSHQFTGLVAGDYKAEVTSGTCYFFKENIEVQNQVFSITSPEPVDATIIGGTGSVSMSFKNRVNNVTWTSGTPSVFNTSENTDNISYSGITPNTYNFTASHVRDGRTCSVSGNFTIRQPYFEAEINIVETNTGSKVSASLTEGNNLITPYRFRVRNSGGTTIATGTNNNPFACEISTGGSYVISLVYNGNNIDLYTFSYPSTPINSGAIVTNPNCANNNGTVNLNPTGGIDNTDLTISTDGVSFTSTTSYSEPAGTFSFYIKDENTTYPDVSGNSLTVNRTLTNYFEETITEPEIVSAGMVMPVDVTCAGSNNGQVSIGLLSGGSGTYEYRVVGTGSWSDTNATVGGLSVGEHTILLRDNGNNCPAVTLTTITINQPDSLLIESSSVTQPTCELDNGAITVEAMGGNGLYSFEWTLNGNPFYQSDSLSADSLAVLGDSLHFGLYNLTVYDNQNCDVHRSFTLNEYVNPTINTVNITDVACYNQSNGSVEITNTGGTNSVDRITIRGLDFTYHDTLTGITNPFSGLRTGRYEINAIDNINCLSDIPYPVVVNQPDTALYSITDTIVPALVKGEATGQILATAYGGNIGLKTIDLLDASSNTIRSIAENSGFQFYFGSLPAGNYTIRVTDAKGCLFTSGTNTVIEPDEALNFVVTEKNDALCKAQTGSFTVEASGGWGNYSFKRATDNGYYKMNTFNNLYAGNYIVSVKDNLGGVFTDTITIIEPRDSLKASLIDYTDPTCANNGSLTINLNGGTAPYKAVFHGTTDTSNFATANNYVLANRPSGAQLLHVTDNNGCIFEMETELSESQLLDIVDFNLTYATNAATADGGIEVITTGGNNPLSYSWSELFGGALAPTGSSLTNVQSDHYEVTITETGGCSITGTVYLPAVTDMSINIVQLLHETAYQANNGSAHLNTSLDSPTNVEIIYPSGIRTNYNYTDVNAQFSTSGGNIYLRNLEGGAYFVAATNAAGEKAYTEFEIEIYEQFYFEDTQITHTRRINDPSGQINVVVTGGAGANTFAWEYLDATQTLNPVDNEYTSTISNVLSGNYRVTVTDRYNNSIVQTMLVEQPASDLDITISEFRNESCKDYEDAYVILQASGGWGDYQFRQDIIEYFENSDTWLNLDVREHYFYITDKMGVVDSVAITITEPDYLTSSTAFVDSVNCKNRSDGNITFDVNGGTAPYRLAFLNQPSVWTVDTIARNLAEGTYEFIFTDSNNCVGQDTLTVYMPEPDSLLFNQIDVTHTTCDTDNGAISVVMQGGTAPYQYEWRDFNNNIIGNDSSISGLNRSGYYFLDVTDVHNCPQHFEQLIAPSTNPVVTDIDTTRVICYGESTGTATIVSVTPATPFAPYNFTWSNADTGTYSDDYAIGIHSVTITDTNNCSTTRYFEVTQPDSVSLVVTDFKDAHCFGYNDGFIEIQPLGGVGNYTYLWSNGSDTTRVDSLYMGDYSIIITDSNLCSYEQSFIISEPPMVIVDLGDDIRMCPDNTVTIDGQNFSTHLWSDSDGLFSNERFVELEKEDEYYLEVTDSIGCFAWDTISITIGNDALKAEFLMSSEAAIGDTISIYEISNLDLDSLNWEYPQEAFLNITDSSAPGYVLQLQPQETGIYNVALQAYSGGCISEAVKQIEIIVSSDTTDNGEFLGYQDPLIQNITVAPNPNNGDFNLIIELREESDIQVVVFSVNYGETVEQRMEYGLSNYDLDFQLYGINTGLYVIMVTAQNERKQIKVIIE